MTAAARTDISGAAAAVETLAREQAWARFLSEARFSLEVWTLDEQVRADCEPVVEWLRRCGRELAHLGGAR